MTDQKGQEDLAPTSSTANYDENPFLYLEDAASYWRYCIELELDGFEFSNLSPSEFLVRGGKL